MNKKPYADKNFGQHFLTNKGVVDKIVQQVVSLSEQNLVVEIGPGPGALTRALLDAGLKVIAFEIDSRMIKHLESEFQEDIEASNLELVHADVTSAQAFSAIKARSLNNLCVCGNLPYNVGTEIVFSLIEEALWADAFCFMLQKEVVQRMICQMPGNKTYGVLGIKLSFMAKLLGHFWVKPGSFSPPPKVDSGVFWYTRKRGVEMSQYQRAKEVVDTAFSQRRKMLNKTLPGIGSDYAQKRPDQLHPHEFWELSKSIAN